MSGNIEKSNYVDKFWSNLAKIDNNGAKSENLENEANKVLFDFYGNNRNRVSGDLYSLNRDEIQQNVSQNSYIPVEDFYELNSEYKTLQEKIAQLRDAQAQADMDGINKSEINTQLYNALQESDRLEEKIRQQNNIGMNQTMVNMGSVQKEVPIKEQKTIEPTKPETPVNRTNIPEPTQKTIEPIEPETPVNHTNTPELTQKNEVRRTANGVNGEIDGVIKQSDQGGCWFISGVLALNSTPKGKEIIKNSITVNDDNSITINFKGVGKSYTISEAELKQHDTDNDTTDLFSNGDNDMLALELASEKLREDMVSGKVKINSSNPHISEANSDHNTGFTVQSLYYLTGIEANEYQGQELTQDKVRKILQNNVNTNNKALGFSLHAKDGLQTHYSAKLTNGETFSFDTTLGHAFAITNISNDSVTFLNPTDTSQSYTMSWDEFEKLGVSRMVSADLNKL